METGKNKNILIVVGLVLIVGLGVGFLLGNGKVLSVNQEAQTISSDLVDVSSEQTATKEELGQNNSEISLYRNPACAPEEYFVDSVCYKVDQILTNPKNGMDYVGVLHNNIVGYVLERSTKETSKEEIGNIAHDYMKSIGNPVDYRKNFADFKESDIETLPANIKIYLDMLASVKDKDLSTKELFDHVISVENKVMSDKTLKTEDKNIILASSSILRHSSLFWTTHEPLNPGNERPFWKDMLGGAVGALIGLIGGPVGAGIGAGLFGAFLSVTW